MPHMKIRSWKTTAFGVVTLAVYIASYIFPEHKEFFLGLVPVMIAGGLLVAKDSNVSGT